jgi:hypothetical protein
MSDLLIVDKAGGRYQEDISSMRHPRSDLAAAAPMP